MPKEVKELLVITEADWSWLEHVATVAPPVIVMEEFYRKALGLSVSEWTSGDIRVDVGDYCVTPSTHDRLFNLIKSCEPDGFGLAFIWLDLGPTPQES